MVVPATELQVIGKGSKAFRKLFGEIEDVRHSVFRRYEQIVYDLARKKSIVLMTILDVDDEAMKAKVTARNTYFMLIKTRHFFMTVHQLQKERLAQKLTQLALDDAMQKIMFKDGVLVNRLSGLLILLEEIAEFFYKLLIILGARFYVGPYDNKVVHWVKHFHGLGVYLLLTS